MSYDDQKNHQIAISTGVNATAVLAARYDNPSAAFVEILDDIVAAVLKVHEVYAIEQAQAAFPGTTVAAQVTVPTAGASVIQFPQAAAPVAAPAPTVAPMAIPGATDGDPQVAALWAEFFNDFNANQFAAKWYDNRSSKTKPGQPDFKNKADGDKALWKTGKKNPAWVPGVLAQAGL